MHTINPHMYGRAMITHLDIVIYTYESVSLSVAPPFGNQSIALQKYGSLQFQNSFSSCTHTYQHGNLHGNNLPLCSSHWEARVLHHETMAPFLSK